MPALHERCLLSEQLGEAQLPIYAYEDEVHPAYIATGDGAFRAGVEDSFDPRVIVPMFHRDRFPPDQWDVLFVQMLLWHLDIKIIPAEELNYRVRVDFEANDLPLGCLLTSKDHWRIPVGMVIAVGQPEFLGYVPHRGTDKGMVVFRRSVFGYDFLTPPPKPRYDREDPC